MREWPKRMHRVQGQNTLLNLRKNQMLSLGWAAYSSETTPRY